MRRVCGLFMEFERLFNEYYDKIYVYIVRRVNDSHAAEDLTSDVFLKAFANQYNPALAKFSTYIFTIAANTLKNHYRAALKINREELDEAFPDGTDLLGDLITREEYAGLRKALAALPERQYEAVYRRYYLDRSFKEIGAALGVSEDGAKKLHRRALDSLKKILESSVPF